MNENLAEYFDGMRFGKLQQYDGMGVLPVFTNNKSNIQYLTLKEAMKDNVIEITEIDERGAVSELRVKNMAELPVLILDGEELVGAKQNRIINTSILLEEKSETIIPVSCVEKDRWAYESRNFKDSDRIASYKLRNVKAESVKISLETSNQYHSNQGAVWDEIHELQSMTKTKSPTSAMGDIYDSMSQELENYIKSFEIFERQKGLIVFINGEIKGLDIVSNESAYKFLHNKLIKSYATDSILRKDDKNMELEMNIEGINNFIDKITKSDESKNKSIGYGCDHRFSTDSYIGSVLVYDDEVIHASFFKSLEISV